jgi:hypothetical protein
MAITMNGFWSGSVAYTDQYSNAINIPFGDTDEDGIAWYWVSMTGWDGVTTVGSVTQNTSDHGGWPTPQFYAPRAMVWNVFAQAPDQATRDLARSKFQRAIPVSDFATFVYNEPIAKTCQIRRQGVVTETYLTLSEVAFAANVVAADPRKYRSTQRSITANALTTPTGGWTLPVVFPLSTPDGLPSGNIVNCPNAGDFETRPVITVQGPVSGPSLESTATGQSISFSNLTLQPTDVLTVDLYNKIARLNGSIVLADVTSVWWVIPPGGTDFIYGGSFGSASSATVTYRDAWQ